jgi:GNAT superfamily N-acetyltransferase
MYVHKKIKTEKELDIGRISVRKAKSGDEEGIYNIACSVSEGVRDSYKGFLMDDYPSEPDYYLSLFKNRIENLEYFFVAVLNGKIVGFSLAYKKRMWLKYYPDWLETINWHPTFDTRLLEDFVLIDKTAIIAEHTGEGVGSLLYDEIIKQMRSHGIHHIFSETLVDPVPNFASLSFRKKQRYQLAGMRYEEHKGIMYTDLIYWKKI